MRPFGVFVKFSFIEPGGILLAIILKIMKVTLESHFAGNIASNIASNNACVFCSIIVLLLRGTSKMDKHGKKGKMYKFSTLGVHMMLMLCKL